MKNLFFVLLFMAGGYLILPSCGKSNANPAGNSDSTVNHTQPDSTGMVPADSVEFRWSVVEDTISNTNSYFVDEGGFPYYPASGNYTGGPNDYVSLQTGGVYSGSENGVSGGGSYMLLPNSGISISSRPAFTKATITTLTDSTMTISGSSTSINDGVLTETLYLKK